MGRRIMELSQADPKGLIRESYAIEGITAGECRSIFLDWALGLKAGTGQAEALRALIAAYGLDRPAHPMSPILSAALTASDSPTPRPERRGGRAARLGG